MSPHLNKQRRDSPACIHLSIMLEYTLAILNYKYSLFKNNVSKLVIHRLIALVFYDSLTISSKNDINLFK